MQFTQKVVQYIKSLLFREKLNSEKKIKTFFGFCGVTMLLPLRDTKYIFSTVIMRIFLVHAMSSPL